MTKGPRITAKMSAEIIKQLNAGEKRSTVAEQFKLSFATISKIDRIRIKGAQDND